MLTLRNKRNNEAWAECLSVHDFDLFVTTKFPQSDFSLSRSDHSQRCIQLMQKYLGFVSSKSFGKKALTDKTRAIKHITFFEDTTKRGDPTVFHAHTLMLVGPKNIEKVSRNLLKEWKKIRLSKTATEPVIENITDVYKVSNYVTKYAMNDHEILSTIDLQR